MYRVSLVMIARNEARCIERCLAGIKDHVDEIIIIDTGSTDDTVEICKRFTPHVGHYAWTDDFSAARNVSLAHASGDWNLVMDADEWMIDGFDYLRSLKVTKPDFVATIRQDSTFGEDADLRTSSVNISRILPRGVAYGGRIHEQPIHAMKVRTSPIIFAHDGYEASKNSLKMGRNEALLRLELKSQPQDAYFNYQLGKDLLVQKRFAEAVAYFERALQHCALLEGWRHDLVIRKLFACKGAKMFDAALDLIAREEERFLDSPDFYFASGDLFLDMSMAMPAHAGTLLPMIESSFLTCRRIGERPDLSGTVHGVGSFLAAHNLYAFYAAIGEADKAQVFLQLSLQEKP